MKITLQKILITLLYSFFVYIGFKHDVSLFQVLSWIAFVIYSILAFIGLIAACVSNKILEKVATPIQTKFFSFILTTCFTAFNVWCFYGKSVELFWIAVIIYAIDIPFLFFVIPNERVAE